MLPQPSRSYDNRAQIIAVRLVSDTRFFFSQAEDGIRDHCVTGVQTCALPICTPDETAAVAKDFKLFYKKVPGKTEGAYTLDHSAGSYVYDTAGRLRVYERYGGGPQVLGADLKALLQEKRSRSCACRSQCDPRHIDCV